MADISEVMAVLSKLPELLARRGITGELTEPDILIESFVVYMETRDGYKPTATIGEGYPIARFYLADVVEPGTLRVDITQEFMNGIADFFGELLYKGLTGEPRFEFLRAVLVGSYFEITWKDQNGKGAS